MSFKKLKMKSVLTIVAALLLSAPGFADHKLEKSVAAPDGIPAALKSAVEAQGVRVLNDAGAPYVELWLAKGVAAENKPAGADVIYSGIPDGTFLGVWRFVAAGSDFRGQPIKPGLYSMRYSLMPADGNHLGASPYRDFVLLVPAGADENPATLVPFERVVPLSRKASGTGHPAVFPMVPAESAGEAALEKNDHGHWILRASITMKSGGSLPIGVTVVGRGE